MTQPALKPLDLENVSDHVLMKEFHRRGWNQLLPELPDDFDPDDARMSGRSANLKTDLHFVRDELIAGRVASALAMLEHILFPNNPHLAAIKYEIADRNRDPETGRPVIA